MSTEKHKAEDSAAFDIRGYKKVQTADEKLDKFMELMLVAASHIGILQKNDNEEQYYMFCMNYSKEALTFNHKFYYLSDMFQKYGLYILASSYANCIVENITEDVVEKLCDKERLKVYFAKDMAIREEELKEDQSLQAQKNLTMTITQDQARSNRKTTLIIAYTCMGAAVFVFVVVAIVVGIFIRRRLYQ